MKYKADVSTKDDTMRHELIAGDFLEAMEQIKAWWLSIELDWDDITNIEIWKDIN